MLRGTYGEQTGRRLFAAAADLTRLAGWTSYDIAAHGLAQRYFVQALRLAQAAGDRAYGAYVLVTMSRQAVYLGHGREAVQLARVAQQGVGSSAPPVVQALLHAVGGARARGARRGAGLHGLAGPGRAGPGGGPARDEVPPWARFFDEAQLADEFGHCHRDLQQYRAAAQHAERSLQLRGTRRSPAAASSAGWSSPRPGSGSANSTRPAAGRGGGADRRRRCGRCGRSSTCGTSSAGWSRTGTRHRCGGTGSGWRCSGRRTGGRAAGARRGRAAGIRGACGGDTAGVRR